MKATEWDLMKLAQAFDGEFSPYDFTPEQLDELLGLISENASPEALKAKYFEFYDDVKDRVLDHHKWSD